MQTVAVNPYAAPAESGVVDPPRRDFPEIATPDLKKLRNDSHSIRTVTALILLGVLILGGTAFVAVVSLADEPIRSDRYLPIDLPRPSLMNSRPP